VIVERAALSPHAAAILAAHQFQGRSNDCGPFTAAMLVNGLRGQALNARQLARALDRPRWHGLRPVVRRVPGWATFPWGVVDALRTYGLSARWRPLARMADLPAVLARGDVPVVILGSWAVPPWAHFLTVLAYHPRYGCGVVDPALPAGELVWRSRAVFERQWRAMGRILITVGGPPDAPAAGARSREGGR
jgi:hypothetical protein